MPMNKTDSPPQTDKPGLWPAFRHAAATFLVVLVLMSLAAHVVFGDPAPGEDRGSFSDLTAIAFIWLPPFAAAGLEFFLKCRDS